MQKNALWQVKASLETDGLLFDFFLIKRFMTKEKELDSEIHQANLSTY